MVGAGGKMAACKDVYAAMACFKVAASVYQDSPLFDSLMACKAWRYKNITLEMGQTKHAIITRKQTEWILEVKN